MTLLLGPVRIAAQQAPAGQAQADQAWPQNSQSEPYSPDRNSLDQDPLGQPSPDQRNGNGQPYSDSAAGYPQDGQLLRQPLNSGQLEQLVAPIALYPDALVAQVLAASTYPSQVAEADRWRQAQGYATPDQIVAGADVQNWDPSVKALTAFPQVLGRMDRNLQWTTDLGNAYFNQPQDVLEAVQIMRRRAQAAGNLQSTPQEAVRYDDGNIELQPANPQVVYVPSYNPWAVYGEPVSPYPGFSLLGAIGGIFAGPVRYGLGIAMSAFMHSPWGWLAWGLDWLGHALLFDHGEYYSHSHSVADWGFSHRRFYAYSGRGGFARGHEFARMGDGGWRRGGNSSGGWHSFNHGPEGRAGNWGGRSRGETRGETADRGFEAFRGDRRGTGAYAGRSQGRMAENRGFAFNRGQDRMGDQRRVGNGAERSGGLQQSYRAPANAFGRGGFGERSSAAFTRSSGKSHSAGFHLFGGGRSQKSFDGGRSAGFERGSSGHAPKGFGGGKSFGGGKGFGGGHSHGGGHAGGGHASGHSGGHGGGHHR